MGRLGDVGVLGEEDMLVGGDDGVKEVGVGGDSELVVGGGKLVVGK